VVEKERALKRGEGTEKGRKRGMRERERERERE